MTCRSGTLAVEHNKTGKITPFGNVFDTETTCILTPVITDGPYYLWGELIRQNVVESEYSRGIPMYLEVQYIDVNTCQPLSNLYVDIWNANATGTYRYVYTITHALIPGSLTQKSIPVVSRKVVTTPLGVGTALFFEAFSRLMMTEWLLSILSFPVITLVEPPIPICLSTPTPQSLPMVPSKSGSITHNGQLFYDDALRSAVEAADPYNTNTIAITSNEEDQWAPEQATSSHDPFIRYVYLGDDISDGIFAWKEIGVNSTADYTNDSDYAIAAYLGANGGYENEGAHAVVGGGSS